MIPKSKHVITQYLETFSPSQVVRDLLRMLATIDLDDNFGLQAEEIHDVGSKDLLTSKLDPVESSTAQSTPQASLRLGRILPQRPGPLTPTLSRWARWERELIVAHLPCLDISNLKTRSQAQINRPGLSCDHYQTVSPLTHKFCGRAEINPPHFAGAWTRGHLPRNRRLLGGGAAGLGHPAHPLAGNCGIRARAADATVAAAATVEPVPARPTVQAIPARSTVQAVPAGLTEDPVPAPPA
ncbi:hypothetical protein BH18PSE1_BH18PSE1_00340 [soil metagenome]